MNKKKKYVINSAVFLAIYCILLLFVVSLFKGMSNDGSINRNNLFDIDKGILYDSPPVYEDGTPVKPKVVTAFGSKETESACAMDGGAITFNSDLLKGN